MTDNDYSKLRKNYEKIRKEAVRKNRDMQKVDEELKESKKACMMMDKNYQASYAEEQSEAAKAYKAKLIEPVEKALTAAENQLKVYRSDYKRELGNITEESLLAQCSTQKEILKEVQDASDILRERLENALGKRFYTQLIQQLNVTKIKLGESDLGRIISYFNRYEQHVQKMTAKPDNIGIAISEIDCALKGLDGSVLQLSSKQTAAAVVFLLILSALAYTYVFPFYVVLLSFIGVYNVYRSYLLYKIIIVHKAVQDNVQEIEELLHQQIDTETEKRKTEITQYYDKRIAEMEDSISNYKKQLTDIAMTADSSFRFDDSGIRSVYDSSLKRHRSKEEGLLKTKQRLKSETDKLEKELAEVKESLDKVIEGLRNKYINFEKPGTEVLFQPEFLFDVDVKRSKPVFFHHPEKSCLILYEDRMEAVSFIRLLCVQIRSSLSPKCYTMTYYDDKTLGRDCLSFVPVSDIKGDAILKIFQLKTTAEDLKETVIEYVMEMRKRQKDLRADRSIRKYNKHMVEIESITLPYVFGFWLDAPSSIIGLPETILLLRAAGDFGIFVHLFVNLVDLYEMGKNAKELVMSAEQIYLLQNGECMGRAKDFVMENLIKKQ